MRYQSNPLQVEALSRIILVSHRWTLGIAPGLRYGRRQMAADPAGAIEPAGSLGDPPMLETISPGAVDLRPYHFVPPFLEPLVAAAAKGADLLPYVESITKSLGFDSFMYGATATPKPDHEAVSYVYTTLPREWVARYNDMAYIEVNPASISLGIARFR